MGAIPWVQFYVGAIPLGAVPWGAIPWVKFRKGAIPMEPYFGLFRFINLGISKLSYLFQTWYDYS